MKGGTAFGDPEDLPLLRLAPAAEVYGAAAARRLGIEREKFYQCQNCNARVGCHKGTTRPLGNLANETLRLKRKETHQIFDSFWRERGMTRTQGYHWMAKKLRLFWQKAAPPASQSFVRQWRTKFTFDGDQYFCRERGLPAKMDLHRFAPAGANSTRF